MTKHRCRPWRLVHICLVISGCVLAGCSPASSGPPPLTGKLTVLVRPPDRNLEPVSVDEPGSLPVQSGGAMCLDARLDEPAVVFVVWLNSAGEALPLYPWNNERLEVTDVDAPPPDRRATKLVFSPLLGHNWTFSHKPGLETVLLLARRTPLPQDVSIGELLGTRLSPRSPGSPEELVVLTYSGGSKTVTAAVSKDRQSKVETTPVDASLSELITRLGKHFDLVQAVQFVHQADAAK